MPATAAPRRVGLYPQQVEFLDRPEPFAAFSGGIGSGKSFVLCYAALRRVAPRRLYMVTAPTYPVLRDATLRSFFDLTERLAIPFEFHRSENRVVFPRTGAEVLFRSTDNPDLLRGPNLAGVAMDEASLSKRAAYDVLVGRLRQGGEPGWLRAALTPKGKTHWTFDVFGPDPATGRPRPDTYLVRAATADNPFLDPEFLARVSRQYGPTPFARQELAGEFVAVEGAEWPPDLIDRPGRTFREWPADVAATVVALDPSKGATEKSDYQAFAVVRIDVHGTLWVDVEANREGVQDMVARGLELAREYAPLHAMVVEDNDGLGMLVDEFRRKLRDRFALMPPLFGVRNTVNKIFRLRRLGGYLATCHERYGPHLRVRDTPGGRLLLAQMADFPLGEYDDCLDALELALRRLEEIAAALLRPGG